MDHFDPTRLLAAGSVPERPGSAGKFAGSVPEHPGTTGKFAGSVPEHPGSAGKFAGSVPEHPGSAGKFAGSVPERPGSAGKFAGSVPEHPGNAGKFAGSVPEHPGTTGKFAGSVPEHPGSAGKFAGSVPEHPGNAGKFAGSVPEHPGSAGKFAGSVPEHPGSAGKFAGSVPEHPGSAGKFAGSVPELAGDIPHGKRAAGGLARVSLEPERRTRRVAGASCDDDEVRRAHARKEMTMTPQVLTVKVELPLPSSCNANAMIQLWNAQSAVIKKCSLYPTTAPVQAAVADMDAAVVQLQGTETEIDQTPRQARGPGEDAGHADRRRSPEARRGCDGAQRRQQQRPRRGEGWTGKTKVRAVPQQLPATTGAPASPMFASIQRHPGSTKASCAEEAGAVAYLFQYGGDPNHPEAWPAPIVSRGHTHTLRNQTIGQLLCVRIAVVRHGSVQGAWSTILQLTVR